VLSPDIATIQALRADVALQVARHAGRLGVSQVSAAKQLGIPQPTLSKIVNGNVSDLSLELLIRIAVRAGLPVILMTGRAPQEAGAFLSSTHAPSYQGSRSRVAEAARASVIRSERMLTPSQQLEAFLEHNQLMGELQHSARTAHADQVRTARHIR
jgi:predicted XRE-type DNA-binding protein